VSGPWERFTAAASEAGPWSKFKPPAQGVSDAAANAFGQGATFNLGDELAAGVRAALPDFSNWMMKGPSIQRDESIGGNPTPQTVSTAPDFQGRYDEELGKIRKQTKADEEAYPALTTGANIAGNVATTALALPAAATAAGPSLVGNVLKMGGTGAALSGASGFGQGEGGFDERLGSALLPAVIGGALGGALPIASAAGRSVMESAPGRAISKGVTESGMVQRLATALQRSKLDPAQVEGRLGQLGDGAMLADVDNQFARMARSSRSMPGATSSHADTVLDARQTEMPGMLRRAFEGETPPPPRHRLMGEGQAFEENARAVGQQAYGKMAADALNMSDDMLQIANVPAVRDALKQIADDAASTGKVLQPTEVMHRVKQKLNDTATAAFASGKPINKADMGDLAREWEAAFWKANPSAKAADTTYAQAKSLPDFFDKGHKFLSGATTQAGMNSSAPALADALVGANAQQVAATRAGSTNAVREMTSARNALGQTRSVARDVQFPEIQARIGEIYEPAQAAGIQRAGDAIRTFDKTDKFVRGGTQTIDKGLEVVEDASNMSLRGGSQGISARIIENVEKLANRLLGPNEAVRDEIGRAMLNPNSAESRRILALAAELLKKRAAGSPIQAGLIEGAASQAGGL